MYCSKLKMKNIKKKYMILALVFLLICVVFSGCNEQTATSIYDPNYHDEVFHLLTIEQSKNLSQNLDSIESAMNLELWELLERRWDEFERDVKTYQEQMDSYILSNKWELIGDYYDLYLFDLERASYYGSTGAEFMQNHEEIKSNPYYDWFWYDEAKNYFSECSHCLSRATDNLDECKSLINSL